jgi:hypothetical protein
MLGLLPFGLSSNKKAHNMTSVHLKLKSYIGRYHFGLCKPCGSIEVFLFTRYISEQM